MVDPYEYTISLRIRHPSLDPAEISRALLLEPSRSWKGGERRRTPVGTVLDGNRAETYWTSGPMKHGNSETTDLATAIEEVLEAMTSRSEFLRRIRAEGGRVELFVGWFFDGQSGDVFDCNLLTRMANLQIDLSLDMYP